MRRRQEDTERLRRVPVWKRRTEASRGVDAEFPTPQAMYSILMKEAFGPALRAVGMRGSAGRFVIPSETYWAQLGFQKSAYSDGLEVRFTVNLSVIGRDEWTERSAAEPHLGSQPTPNTHYGSWAHQIRIGKLTPSAQDKWWRLVRGQSSEDVRNDALHDLTVYAVPWLHERMT